MWAVQHRIALRATPPALGFPGPEGSTVPRKGPFLVSEIQSGVEQVTNPKSADAQRDAQVDIVALRNALGAQGNIMAAKDRLQKSLDSIKEVLREVQRLQPSVPPLHPRVRNQLQSTTRKLTGAVTEIEAVMRELDSSVADVHPQ